jgi:hypothetical protein
MFYNALRFNQPSIAQWNMENTVDLSGMFSGALAFNSDISEWGNVTTSLRNINFMFEDAIAFNQPIGTWNTEKLESMVGLFDGAKSFNQPNMIDWSVSKIKDFTGVFARSGFNSNIATWNVSASGCFFDHMFANASRFDQDLNQWRLQLGNKTSCGGIDNGYPSVTDIFRGTKCNVATSNVFEPFCRLPFSVYVCLKNQFDAVGCNCTQPAECLSALLANATMCREKFIIAGRNPNAYDRKVNQTFTSVCAI